MNRKIGLPADIKALRACTNGEAPDQFAQPSVGSISLLLVTLRAYACIILAPLNPLGFTRVYIIFLISAQKHRLLVLVRTASSF